MTGEIVDFPNSPKREIPAEGCTKRDDYGREMFLYALDYNFDGGYWGLTLWAYSDDDARTRVEAMRRSLVFVGQIFEIIPGLEEPS